MVLTGFDRLRLIERIADRLPQEVPPAIELDVQTRSTSARWPTGSRELASEGNSTAWCTRSGSCRRRDGHQRAPFFDAPGEDVAKAIHISACSYASLARAVLPIMNPGGSHRRHGLRSAHRACRPTTG